MSLDVAIFLFSGIPNGPHQVTLIYLKTQDFRTFQKDLVGSIWWTTEPEKMPSWWGSKECCWWSCTTAAGPFSCWGLGCCVALAINYEHYDVSYLCLGRLHRKRHVLILGLLVLWLLMLLLRVACWTKNGHTRSGQTKSGKIGVGRTRDGRTRDGQTKNGMTGQCHSTLWELDRLMCLQNLRRRWGFTYQVLSIKYLY